MKLNVLYLDNHLLVVNKNPGILVQKDKTGDIDVLTLARSFLKNKFQKPGNVYIGLVHRLDRPVSGVMALARTTKAASRLSAQFRNNTARKKYMALVEGNCSGHGSCADYILKENQKVRIVDSSHPKALYAELSWKSAARMNNLSLIEVTLKTGRPHQIRVQMANMGFPVQGDFRYGAKSEFDGKNIALHCYYLGLEHPVNKEIMSWTAGPPPTWSGKFENAVRGIIRKENKKSIS
jgi:RluA family pseudouridine synthase